MSKYNALTTGQHYALRKWLDGRREHAAKTTAANLAREASDAVGFPVTKSNIQAARSDLNICIRAKGGGHAFVSRTRMLAVAVSDLYSALGLPIPHDLTDIVEGTKK